LKASQNANILRWFKLEILRSSIKEKKCIETIHECPIDESFKGRIPRQLKTWKKGIAWNIKRGRKRGGQILEKVEINIDQQPV
jgi:hypothetical protein